MRTKVKVAKRDVAEAKPWAALGPMELPVERMVKSTGQLIYSRADWIAIIRALTPKQLAMVMQETYTPTEVAKIVRAAAQRAFKGQAHMVRRESALVVSCSATSKYRLQRQLAAAIEAEMQDRVRPVNLRVVRQGPGKKPLKLTPPRADEKAVLAAPVGPVEPVAATAPNAAPHSGLPPSPLDVPLSALLPIAQQMLTNAVRELMTPMLAQMQRQVDRIEPLVKKAIEDELGQPTPPAAPPPGPVPAVEDVAAPAPAEPEPEPVAAEALPIPQPDKEPAVPMVPATPPKPQPVVPPGEKHGGLADQLEVAAQKLGMDHVARQTYVICGMHPRVADRLQHAYGHAYRFVFLRPDALERAADIPASADGLLLHRKRLNSELSGIVNRYNLPVRHIANDVGSAMQAIQQLTAETV